MTRLTTTRRRFLAGTAALGAAGTLPFSGPAWAQGTTLNVRADSDPTNLDPGYTSGGVDFEVLKQTVPYLATYESRPDGSFGWRPSWYVTRLEQVDPTHIEFELQDYLEWSGGYGPVLASDVKYSLERMKGTDWSGYFDAMDRVEVTGERTGTIVLSEPFAPFIMITLAHGPAAILSEAAMKEVGEEFTLEIPATCGPYTYELIPGQRVVFTRDPNWQGPAPDYERVVAHVITEAKAAELGFEAGELDVTELSADTLARYREEPPEGAEITVAGALQYMWLGMNTEHPKLQDIRVRRVSPSDAVRWARDGSITHAVHVAAIMTAAHVGVLE